ncbi:uncharacterized protein LOC135122151 [Zophobas morio]|uniref:uncharacterized protein LOC135122151 n=1 Tax=Zophobas morio TaxID=2755281 RepID=UPI0030830F81
MSFYEAKAILITGGTGFIGGEVSRHLTIKYPEKFFVVYDKLEYSSSINNIKGLLKLPNFKFIKGDIQNYDLVLSILEIFKIDTLLNFAAQSHVDLSFKNSLEFTKTNVLGTHVLLEAARKVQVKRFIHVSTDEVYGDIPDDSAKETRTLDPTNPYAFSKAAAELVVKAYIKSFQFPAIITRGNNVYGPRQFPEKVIPKFILRLLHGMKCCIHGKGNARRTYVYISDVADAFDLIIHRGKIHEVYNVGSFEEYTIKELALIVINKIHGVEGEAAETYIEYVKDRLINDQRYSVSTEKLANLGWQAQHDFEQGLEKTIEWYKHEANDWWSEYEYALAAHSAAQYTC